uniref:BPTI/Kunitz inhibitor domain-containing protein n=1 Tax=Heterorhabditis bacteriophora TaxID=37862 RepID=A0A1I7X0W2_HETBA
MISINIILAISLVSSQELLDNPLCNHLPERGQCLNYRTAIAPATSHNPQPTTDVSSPMILASVIVILNDGISTRTENNAYAGSDSFWWSGCGGNSNMYYSYNHCMLICGEFVENGPGIDDKYWDKKNSSQLETSAILSNPVSGYFHQRTNGSTFQTNHTSKVKNDRTLKMVNYLDERLNLDLKTNKEPYVNMKSTISPIASIDGWKSYIFTERKSISGTTENDQQHKAHGTIHIEHIDDAPLPAVGRLMLTPSRSLTDDSELRLSEMRRMRTQKISPLTLDKGKWGNITHRAHGERVYRYDSGPVSRTSADEPVTVNRQVLVIMKKKNPSMKFMQHLPNMVEFTRITPPPPFSTMISPILRRRIKIIQKKKIPPRVINPQVPSATRLQIQANSSTDNRQVIRQKINWSGLLPTVILPREFTQVILPTYPPSSTNTSHSHKLAPTHIPSTSTTQYAQIRHYPENSAGPSQYLMPVITASSPPTPSSHILTTRPPVKLAEVRPMIIDAERKFPLITPLTPPTSPTNLRVEAESIEYLRPIIENVTAQSPISMEEVISLNSYSFDDYDDQIDTSDFESNCTNPQFFIVEDENIEIPTVAVYPQTISTPRSSFTKSSVVSPTTQPTTQLNILPTRPSTIALSKTTNWTPIVFPMNHGMKTNSLFCSLAIYVVLVNSSVHNTVNTWSGFLQLQVADLVYVDNPVGAGFSYVDHLTSLTTNVAQIGQVRLFSFVV